MIPFEPGEEKKYEVSTAKKVGFFIARLFSYPFVDFFYKVLNRSRAIGRENIPKEGGVVIASNHVSGVDTVLIPALAIRRFSLMPLFSPAKEELFKVPVLRTILKLWASFPVKRGARDVESMKRIACYAKNYHVMIFPEGTRSRTGELLRGRSGVGWIVYWARPKVVPTLVINTDKYFWPGRPRPWFGIPYTVVFGEPLDLSRFYEAPDTKKTSQAIADEIMRAIAELKEKNKGLYM
ncbi:MAG: lysophospholipid acyltransferase family protein [Candidatus Nitrospinota bacterium M3_3B_026]